MHFTGMVLGPFVVLRQETGAGEGAGEGFLICLLQMQFTLQAQGRYTIQHDPFKNPVIKCFYSSVSATLKKPAQRIDRFDLHTAWNCFSANSRCSFSPSYRATTRKKKDITTEVV